MKDKHGHMAFLPFAVSVILNLSFVSTTLCRELQPDNLRKEKIEMFADGCLERRVNR